MNPKTALNVAKKMLDSLTEAGFLTVAAESKPTVYTLTPFGAGILLLAVRLGFTRVIEEDEVFTFLLRREEKLIPFVDAVRYLRARGMKTQAEERVEDLLWLFSLFEKEVRKDILEGELAESLERLKGKVLSWTDLAYFVVEPLVRFMKEEEPAKTVRLFEEALEAADPLLRSHVEEALRHSLKLLTKEVEEEKRKVEEKIQKIEQLRHAFNL